VYTAGSVLVRLLSQGIEILQRRKDYTAAVSLLRQLLGQNVYNLHHHGYWWDRLALNLDVHLKQQEQVLFLIFILLVSERNR
jgi:Fanconi-associated nuclease 1